MIKDVHVTGQDNRVRKYLAPKAILYTQGQVFHIDALLKRQEFQISTSEPHCTVLKNEGGPNAAFLLDFGMEFAGGIRLAVETCTGEATPVLRLRFGESVGEAMSDVGQNGSSNDHSPRDFEVKTTSFSDLEFGQTGFRFVRIDLLSPKTSVRLKAVTGVFTYRNIEYKGSFRCSDPLLNTIYDVAAYTCHLNMQHMLWDGIKRDRLVWIGDIHPEMLTIRTVFGEDRCIEEGLDYAIKKAPLPDYPNGMVTYAMWWLLICRDWYFTTGRDTFIQEHAAYIRALLLQLCELVDENGADRLAQYPTGYFLDWPTFEKEDAKAGVRALFSLALRAGAELCEHIDGHELAGQCRKYAALLTTKAFPALAKASVAMMALAGHMDSANAAERLLKDGTAGFSTFMSYYILTALARSGHTAEALDLLKNYYGGMLAAGATTFWEDFSLDWYRDGSRIDTLIPPGGYDIHRDNGAFCYTGYRHSLCHGWSSAPTAFLAEQVLGITFAEPGGRRVRIQPCLGALEYAEGTFPTPFGIIAVHHSRQTDGSIRSDIKLPDGILSI